MATKDFCDMEHCTREAYAVCWNCKMDCCPFHHVTVELRDTQSDYCTECLVNQFPSFVLRHLVAAGLGAEV